ncbi:MAG: hypothetical protein IAE80_20390 [Anaerolinea sp.]|nr:hypothetical protein [Anaerolinea sp.]
MPIKSTWLVKGHIIFAVSWGEVTPDEFAATEAPMQQFLNNAEADFLHVVVDHSLLESLPRFQQMIQRAWGTHPRLGWVIFYGVQSSVLAFQSSMTAQLLKVRLRFVDTLADALTYLQQADNTLPDLRAIDMESIRAQLLASGVPEHVLMGQT